MLLVHIVAGTRSFLVIQINQLTFSQVASGKPSLRLQVSSVTLRFASIGNLREPSARVAKFGGNAVELLQVRRFQCHRGLGNCRRRRLEVLVLVHAVSFSRVRTVRCNHGWDTVHHHLHLLVLDGCFLGPDLLGCPLPLAHGRPGLRSGPRLVARRATGSLAIQRPRRLLLHLGLFNSYRLLK